MSKIATFIILILLFSPLPVSAQGRLGITFKELQSNFPNTTFSMTYLEGGSRCAMGTMALGTFIYYFSSETGLINLCVQIPENIQALNAQVEIYNKKYVVLSETSWKAYLDGGVIMKISLEYKQEFGTYLFYYTY